MRGAAAALWFVVGGSFFSPGLVKLKKQCQ
jgi:hypothetical protein